MLSWRKIRFLSLLLALVICESTAEEATDPVINTKYGQLMGRSINVKGKDTGIYVYLGVPFAKPPTGALRFTSPQPPEPWKGKRDATVYPPMCLQNPELLRFAATLFKVQLPTLSAKEDCLYLNIYTPVKPTEEAKLPVMVWIHGGGLMIGGASMLDGSALAAYENVVVVMIQYRLGILGFLSTGDETARGNWGFLDQVEALQWIQENIKSFGGDPNSVTIFGESAGGISVSMQVLSPMSKGLFHKAISESGVASFPGLVSSNPKQIMSKIANITGCDTVEFGSAFECLRNKSEEEIVNATIEMKLEMTLVVVDGIFLTEQPSKLLEAKEFHDVPYLLGTNNQEFGWILPSSIGFFPAWENGTDKKTVSSIINDSLKICEELQERIRKEYMGDTEDPARLRDLLLELLGDIMFVVPAVTTARFHRDGGYPVYLYEFQYRPAAFKDSRPDFVESDHGDELGFVFGGPFWNDDIVLLGNVTDEEKVLSKTLMAYWANFARTGSPNGDGLVEWPIYDQNEEYMELNLEQKVSKKLKEHRMAFWTKIILEESKTCQQNSAHTEF
ncbi:fatty acyl-CoA hydrolase precursor, medium chain-like [Latimeria chalumnae]|uniref:fatty acyl-CoA hydrolase precursor, medium chain-like n=1 Tax=Latimeria chalumnae TaxID=7897 RepID=UPI00313E51E7